MDSIITLAVFLMVIVALYYGVRWIAKPLLPADGPQNRKITFVGFIFIFIFMGILLTVFALEYIAPQITDKQRYLIIAVVFVAGIGLEFILKKFGIKLARSDSDKNV